MSRAFIVELRARLAGAREHVELLERVLAFYENDDLNEAPGSRGRGRRQKKAHDTAARPSRTRAGAAEAALARQAQPVETGKSEPPSAPRPSAKALRRPGPDEIPADHKWCGYGEHVVPRSAFGKNTAKPDGLQTWCSPCFKENYGRGGRGKPAAGAKGKPARSPKASKEPEPVSALALVDKRCVRCKAVKDAEEFIGDTGMPTARCRRCLALLSERGEAVGELSKAEHAARMERIARRVAQRSNRRHGLKHIDCPFVRCLVARAPATAGDTVLTVHASCGAVVIAGDELDHLDDVHQMTGLFMPGELAQLFAPIAAAAGGGQDDDDEDLGLSAGVGG